MRNIHLNSVTVYAWITSPAHRVFHKDGQSIHHYSTALSISGRVFFAAGALQTSGKSSIRIANDVFDSIAPPSSDERRRSSAFDMGAAW